MSIKKQSKLMFVKLTLLLGIMLYASSSLADSAARATTKSPQSALQLKLDILAEKLEKQRQQLHIPGMAIAIVKDDKLIMAKGFGFSNLEQNIKASPETIFAIGSSSKAFTATLVGMQVDDNKMKWDAPVTKYLPFLDYSLDDKDAKVTLRDMLSHRSGYIRNDILWANGKASRDKILRTSLKAKPYSAYQEKFNYNNVMYLGAGIASAKQSDTDWDTLLEQRILQPLGMSDSTSRFAKAQKNPNLAKGYIWNAEAQEYQLQTMQDLTNIAPAGAINSNVLDMAKWLKFQLNNGLVDGQRLISEQALQEIHSPQISLAKSVDYGLGWFIRQWQGQAVIEHGGNIAGFAAQVAFLPESNLGYVLLTNVTATPLQQSSMNIVWETLLASDEFVKEKSDLVNAAAKDSHQQYVADYIANFAHFKDSVFSVSDKSGVLHVNVPGQMDYALKEPNEEGKWFFQVTDSISVSFDRNSDGDIIAMRMQQAGMNFDIPKKGLAIKPEIAAEQLKDYLGLYQSSTFKGNIKAIIQNHRLALDVPGQMVFELALPNEKQERLFRVNSTMKAIFDYDDAKQVSELKIYRAGKLIDTAKRIAGKTEKLATVAELLELRKTKQRKNAFVNIGGIRLTGSINFVHAGLTGKVTSSIKGKDSLLVNMDLGEHGYNRSVFNATSGSEDGIQQYRALEGKYLLQAQKQHLASDVDWRDFFETINVVGVEEFKGKKTYLVKLKSGDLPVVTLNVDAQTGDVLKRQSNQLVPVIGQLPMTFIFEDYRDIDGLRIPFKTIAKNPMTGSMVMQFNNIETNLSLSSDIFVVKESD